MVCPSVALTPESTIQRRFRTKVNCKLKRVQRRKDHWAIVDLVGKGGHYAEHYTIPMENTEFAHPFAGKTPYS